jgi:hypothetical protein
VDSGEEFIETFLQHDSLTSDIEILAEAGRTKRIRNTAGTSLSHLSES